MDRFTLAKVFKKQKNFKQNSELVLVPNLFFQMWCLIQNLPSLSRERLVLEMLEAHVFFLDFLLAKHESSKFRTREN